MLVGKRSRGFWGLEIETVPSVNAFLPFVLVYVLAILGAVGILLSPKVRDWYSRR